MSPSDVTPVQSQMPTAETPKTKEEVQEEATTLLTTGKRNLLVNDVPAAVSVMSQACELLSKMFGETAIECAEAYYFYGKALLELSRLESGVLGNALDGVPEEEDEANSSKVEDPSKLTDEEKNEVEEKVSEALKENFVDLEKKSEETKQVIKGKTEEAVAKEEENGKISDDGKKSESNEEKQAAANEVGSEAREGEKAEGDEAEKDLEGDDSHDEADESKEGMVTDEIDGDVKDKEASDKNDEEPSNLQLAWEMLELAKVAYSKQIETGDADNKKEYEEKLCKTMMALGEVSIENENYCQAVEDLQMCLKKREAMPKDSRLVSETQYQLGVAQGFNKQYDEAVKSLNSAIEILKERVENIKNEEKSSDAQKKEVEELEALIPEIEGKIADTEDMKKESEAKQKGEDVGFEVDASAKGDVEAASIAVKRKAEGDDSINKKVAIDVKTAGAS